MKHLWLVLLVGCAEMPEHCTRSKDPDGCYAFHKEERRAEQYNACVDLMRRCRTIIYDHGTRRVHCGNWHTLSCPDYYEIKKRLR